MKVKTLDGERTKLEQLNTGAYPADQRGFRGWVQRCYKNMNLVMAGMYTGLNCYGTPKTHHDYDPPGMGIPKTHIAYRSVESGTPNTDRGHGSDENEIRKIQS